MQGSLPVAERPRRPEWMKVRAPSQNDSYFDVKKLIHGAQLHTICEEARCPNIAECWGRGTATFQILGETCTRACRYCYVNSGQPNEPVDPLEPLRLAQTAKQMGLKHVVVTSVDRDDVPDRGAGQYAATIRAVKAKLPESTIEVLTPDFLGVEEEALATVIGARPDVFNHNIETVRRLHRRMRGAKASYDKALWLLQRAKEIADYDVLTKSGDHRRPRRDERRGGRDDARPARARRRRRDDRPVPAAEPEAREIDRWVHPDEFRWLREQGEALGFGSVFAGPLVRSSYRADEQRHAAATGRGAVALLEGPGATRTDGPVVLYGWMNRAQPRRPVGERCPRTAARHVVEPRVGVALLGDVLVRDPDGVAVGDRGRVVAPAGDPVVRERGVAGEAVFRSDADAATLSGRRTGSTV